MNNAYLFVILVLLIPIALVGSVFYGILLFFHKMLDFMATYFGMIIEVLDK